MNYSNFNHELKFKFLRHAFKILISNLKFTSRCIQKNIPGIFISQLVVFNLNLRSGAILETRHFLIAFIYLFSACYNSLTGGKSARRQIVKYYKEISFNFFLLTMLRTRVYTNLFVIIWKAVASQSISMCIKILYYSRFCCRPASRIHINSLKISLQTASFVG